MSRMSTLRQAVRSSIDEPNHSYASHSNTREASACKLCKLNQAHESHDYVAQHHTNKRGGRVEIVLPKSKSVINPNSPSQSAAASSHMNARATHTLKSSVPPAYMWDDVAHACMVALPVPVDEKNSMSHMNTTAGGEQPIRLITESSASDTSGKIVAMTNGRKLNILAHPVTLDIVSSLPEHMTYPFQSETDYNTVLQHTNACGCNAANKSKSVEQKSKSLKLSDGTEFDVDVIDAEQARQGILRAEMQNGALIVHPMIPNSQHLNTLASIYKSKPVPVSHTNARSDASPSLSTEVPKWNLIELSEYANLAMQHKNTAKNARMVAAVIEPDANTGSKKIQAFFNTQGRLIVPKEDVLIKELPPTVAQVYVAHNNRRNLDQIIQFARSDKCKSGDRTLTFTVASAESTRRDLMNAQPSQRK